MRYAFAKLALVTTVLTVFAADATAQGRGRRGGGNIWNNVASWYLPSANTGWYVPGTYSNWNYPVTYGDSWSGRGGYRSYYTPSYSYYTPSYSYYTTPSTAVVTSNPVITQTSFYEPSDSRKSLLTVIVPTTDAQVWLNGTLMSSQGFERNYSSPPLETGLNYTYSVKAQWMVDGRPVEQLRDVTVRAGQRSTVDFRQPSGQPAPLPVPNNLK
jgi:uncharacterized protein (TIGR03000 family)